MHGATLKSEKLLVSQQGLCFMELVF